MIRNPLSSSFALVALATGVLLAAAARSDVNVNPSITWHGESSLVVDPANPARLVAGWMKLTAPGQVSVVVSRTTNGGATWSAPVAFPHTQSGHTSADPTFLWSRDGMLYGGYIDYDKANFASGAFYVRRSSDGGVGWTSPVAAIPISPPDRPADRPWLALDESGGPWHGRLYAVGKNQNDTPYPHRVWLTWSDDQGQTWSALRTVDDSLRVNLTIAMGVPAVTAGGAFLVAYLSYEPLLDPLPRFVCRRSRDGGDTFTTHVIARLPANAAFASGDSLYQFSYHLAAHPSNPDRLVFTWTDARNGDPDVFAALSRDAGVTWSAPSRVNDDPPGNGVGQDMSWGAFTPNGAYVAAWRDRRDAGTGQLAAFRVYAARTLDGGASFEPNLAVSAGASPAIGTVSGNDFLGVAALDTSVSCTWADARGGALPQLYFARASLAPVALSADAPGAVAPSVRVAGNPARGAIRVSLRSWGEGTVRVDLLDVSGRIVSSRAARTGSSGEATVVFADRALPPGIYLARAVQRGRIATTRLVIAR